MRGVQRLVRREDHPVHTRRRGCLQQNFKNRGSVDNDQRFLSIRTASAGAGCGRTDCRLESRFFISSSVGRSRA